MPGNFCEGDQTPQRAVVRFDREGETFAVVGGTASELGDSIVRLGFAGAPDLCERIPSFLPIHGVIVRKP